MAMFDQRYTLRRLLAQLEVLQRKTQVCLDAIDSRQPMAPASELVAACSRLLVLSCVFLEMARKANKTATSILRSEGKE
jgi:hypothetical protein